MKINKQALLLFILLFFAIYQDFPAVLLFGQIASTPIIFLVIPMFFYLLSFKKTVITKYTVYYIYYTIYLCIISVIYAVYLILSKETFIFLDENIILKTVKTFVYPVTAIVFYQFCYTYLKNGNSKLDNLLKAIVVIQILIALYLPFEIYFISTRGNLLPFLHGMSEKYWRIRLLTFEESYVGTIISVFIFIPVFLVNYLDKKRNTKMKVYFLSAFIFLLYIFFSQSKGFLLLTLISTLPMTIQYLYNNKKIRKALIFLTPLLIFVFIFTFIVLNDILEQKSNTSGTFGTRFTSYIAALRVFIFNPFGVGWSGLLYYYPEAISATIREAILTNFDLSEIKTYTSTAKNLSTKTEFFDGLIYGGVGFIYFFYKFYIGRYIELYKIKKTNFFFLKAPLAFCLLAGLIYVPYLIKYEVWFLIAFIDVIQGREKDV